MDKEDKIIRDFLLTVLQRPQMTRELEQTLAGLAFVLSNISCHPPGCEEGTGLVVVWEEERTFNISPASNKQYIGRPT